MNGHLNHRLLLLIAASAALATLLCLGACTITVPPPGPAEPAGAYAGPYEEPEPATDRSLFRDLTFYGSWHWVEPFGWVWRPNVVLEWRPFVNGRWIYTEFGWTWISYEPFGWATCHYGYWAVDFALGWIWIPDYEWYPARVEWIVLDEYICWSPLPFEGYYWVEPWERGDVDAWVIVRRDHFTESSVGRYHDRLRFRTSGIRSRQAPEPRSRYGYPLDPIRVELSHQGVDDRIVRQIMLPPDMQHEIDRQVSDRDREYREARRHPDAPKPPDDTAVEPRPREPRMRDQDQKKQPQQPEQPRKRPEVKQRENGKSADDRGVEGKKEKDDKPEQKKEEQINSREKQMKARKSGQR